MLEIRAYPLKHCLDTALNAGATVKKCDKKFQLRLLLRFLRGELDRYIITMLLLEIGPTNIEGHTADGESLEI